MASGMDALSRIAEPNKYKQRMAPYVIFDSRVIRCTSNELPVSQSRTQEPYPMEMEQILGVESEVDKLEGGGEVGVLTRISRRPAAVHSCIRNVCPMSSAKFPK